MRKVCYFTSKVSTDVRIFEKECTSLAKGGFQVYLVSPNAKEEIKNGVHIVNVPFNKKGEYHRLFSLPKLLYKKALSINADIYHFNDPQSLPYGSKLKRKGKKVIFDSFEDHPTLLLEKKSIPFPIIYLLSKIYSAYEYYNCKNFDALILCYHWTQDRLSKACENNKLIFNFPIIKENILDKENYPVSAICYAGLFSEIWNIENIVSALPKVDDIKFNLAGHGDNIYIERLKGKEGWSKVNYLGKLKFEDVYDKVYSKSNIGIALLDYIPLCKGNVGNLSNNKLFEYMLAGLPVICTDFILWKEVVEVNSCGICVNPRNINEIVDAITYLQNNPDIAKQMGKNGQKIVKEKYNWKAEEKKLINLYKSL